MQSWPNITPVEVAVVCSAALLLCFLPSVLALGDSRRQRRRGRALLAEVAAQRQAVETGGVIVSPEAFVGTAGGWTEAPQAVEAPVAIAPEASAADMAPAHESAAPVMVAPAAVETAAASGVLHAEPVPSTPSTAVPPAPAPEEPVLAPAHEPESHQAAAYTLRLDELRRVKLPSWPPQEVRDDPERKRVWDEAVRLADQPLITRMQLPSPRAAESACLSAVENNGSTLRLRFLLFADLWPVAAEQATAEAVFDVDSANGDVRAVVRSLRK